MNPVEPDKKIQIGDRVAAILGNPWIVVAILFLVTGALGIPLIWLCRAFSTRAKILLTFAVTIYTVLILWVFWLIMLWCYHRIVDAL